MSTVKTHVKVGDEVEIISGNHKGKQGKVTSINAGKQQVTVEGARKIKKTLRKSEQNPDGGIEEKDGPVHLSNVKKV